MGRLISIALKIAEYAIWIGFALVAISFLVFLWGAFFEFVVKRIWEYSPSSTRKRNTVRVLGTVGLALGVILILAVSGYLYYVAYTKKIYWNYIYAAGLSVGFPAFVTLFLCDWWEKRRK